MTAPTVFAAVSTAPLPHHLDAAEVYIRRCHADRELTQGKVAELAHALASRTEWQQAIDSDRADLLAALKAEKERADRAESLARAQAATARRWRLEFERQQRINSRALLLVDVLDPQAGPGHIGAARGQIRTALASSRGHAVPTDHDH